MQMQKKFNEYWDEYSLILYDAVILNPRYKLNMCTIALLQFMVLMLQTLCKPFLAILKLLFDEYVKNSKSMSSSLAGSSNVSNNDPVDSSLHQLNVNSANLRGDYDE
ncbi:hypothetical protein Gohar_018856, partial [Gossypium harknessii]|nr:hypothetical protein [Gossypium harknessii]